MVKGQPGSTDLGSGGDLVNTPSSDASTSYAPGGSKRMLDVDPGNSSQESGSTGLTMEIQGIQLNRLKGVKRIKLDHEDDTSSGGTSMAGIDGGIHGRIHGGIYGGVEWGRRLRGQRGRPWQD